MENNKKVENKNIFMWFLLGLVLILLLFFPKIYDFFQTSKLPKINTTDKKEKEEEKVIDEDVLETIHFPIMRSSAYDSNTYYSLKEFTASNLSNNDILLTAFLDVYEGNMVKYNGYVPCTKDSRQFNKDYIELRIKNIIGKNINYNLENFYVPEDSNSKYSGSWRYDSNNGIFIYEGLCQSKATDIRYYDLKQLIKMEYQGRDIVANYYVGFAKVEGNNYTIYSDASMQNQIGNGTINDINELDSLFKSIDNKVKKVYKYTFKDTLCSYNEYCLYKGEWVDEL